ncbi:MAG: hypothetical protein AAGG01_05740 [Planctomycetota bacterium]
MSDMTIAGNCIRVDTDGWRETQDAFQQAPTGISLEGRSDGDIEGLTIVGNSIRFRPLSTSRPWDRRAHGIELFAELAEDAAQTRIVIDSNTIVGCPSAAMYIGGTIDGFTLRRNTVRSRSAFPAAVPDGFRSGIIFFGSYASVRCDNNCFLDPDQTLRQVFYLFDDNRGSASIERTGWTGDGGPGVFVRADSSLSSRWQVGPFSDRCVRGLGDRAPVIRCPN